MARAKHRTKRKPKSPSGVGYAEVCKLAMKLPEVEESTSYGTPALKVRGKLMARLKEDGESLVLRTTLADRERLLAAAPDALYLTDHYVSVPWILVRLPKIEISFLHELIAEAWRLSAPAHMAQPTKRKPASKRR
jgi:hypothetical protein